MKDYHWSLLALAFLVLIFGLVGFSNETRAQIVPAQNQVILAPYGGPGFVVSTSSTATHKLSATSTPFFASFFATLGDIKTLTLPNQTSALLQTNGSGVVAEYAGTTCTNQFVRALSALGLATCESVNLASDVTGTLPVANGGTGSTTLSGILRGDGTAFVKTTVIGSGLTFDGTTLAATGGSGGGLSTTTPWTPGDIVSVVNDSTVTSVATTSISAGTGIGFTGTAGRLLGGTNLTITNNGVTSNVAGTGINVSGATGAVTITNAGVTSLAANSPLSVNAATGAITVSCAGCLTSALTSIGPAGQLANGPTVTLATTTSSFNGLTVGTTIVGAGDTLTWTPTLAGTLGIGGGGTGTSTPANLGQVLSWNGTNYQAVATSSLNIAASPAGANTQVQFNDSGILGATADFIFDKVAKLISVGMTGSGYISELGDFTGLGVGGLVLRDSNGSGIAEISTGFFGDIGASYLLLNSTTTGSNITLLTETNEIQVGNGTATSILNFDAPSATRTFNFPNLSGSPALGSFTTGFTGGAVPFGSSGMLATSTALTFDSGSSRLTVTNASTTAISSSYASSTAAFAGTLTLPNLATAAGTFLAANASGQVIATTTPSGGATVTTMIPFPSIPVLSGAGTQTAVNDDTLQRLCLFDFPAAITVNKISVKTGGTVATSGTFDFTIYSENGQTREILVTTASVTTGDTIISTAVSAVTLTAGKHWFGFNPNTTADSQFYMYTAGANASLGVTAGLPFDVASEPIYCGSTAISSGTPVTTFDPTTLTERSVATGAMVFRLDN